MATFAGLVSTCVLIAPPLQAADETIKIGVVVPITSVLAPYGTPFVESMNLAIDAANASGGINGRKLELVVEDSQASNTVAINALNKVLQSNPIAVFGPALGTQVLAMMPISGARKDSIYRRTEHAPRDAAEREILLPQLDPRRDRQGDVDALPR